MLEINTHNLRVDFGEKHRGKRYTRLPVSYLKWMVRCNHTRKPIAEAELQRRGTTTPDMDISGHAIDRISLVCLKKWQETSNKDEGLNSWIVRMCKEALSKSTPDDEGRIHYNGMRLVFEMDEEWPVLKTVMRKDK